MSLAFLYAGQGSQHPGMGADLYEAYPAFRAVLDSAAEQVDFDLKEVSFTDANGVLNQTAYTQPAMVAFAAGVTTLRREASARLLSDLRFAVIRGNASEIKALAGGGSGGSGVDVSAADAVTEENLSRTVELARGLARRTGAVAAVSGAVDIVTDGEETILLRGGCPTMARITGSGCMLAALTGAFCGASPEHPFAAAAAAAAALGVAGELAEAHRLRSGAGNASFRTHLIDGVFRLTETQLREGVRYEVYQG